MPVGLKTLLSPTSPCAPHFAEMSVMSEFGFVASYFRYLVFKDASWKVARLNFDSDIAFAEKLNGKDLSATDPNLSEREPDKTRPLCAFPKIAKYKGTGSTDEASSFVCTQP